MIWCVRLLSHNIGCASAFRELLCWHIDVNPRFTPQIFQLPELHVNLLHNVSMRHVAKLYLEWLRLVANHGGQAQDQLVILLGPFIILLCPLQRTPQAQRPPIGGIQLYGHIQIPHGEFILILQAIEHCPFNIGEVVGFDQGQRPIEVLPLTQTHALLHIQTRQRAVKICQTLFISFGGNIHHETVVVGCGVAGLQGDGHGEVLFGQGEQLQNAVQGATVQQAREVLRVQVQGAGEVGDGLLVFVLGRELNGVVKFTLVVDVVHSRFKFYVRLRDNQYLAKDQMRLRTEGDQQLDKISLPTLPRIHSNVTLHSCNDLNIQKRNHPTSSTLNYDLSLSTQRRTRLHDITQKQSKLITLLNSQISQLKQLKQTTLKLNQYYREKTGEIVHILEGEMGEIEKEMDFMLVLEKNVRRYVDSVRNKIEGMEKEIKRITQQKQKVVEKRVEVKVPGVPVFVEKIVEKPVYIEKIKQIQKPVVKVEYKDREVEKIVYVDKPVFVDRPVEKIIQKIVPGPPVEKIVQKIVYVDKPIYIEKEVEKLVEGPPKIVYVDRVVEKPVFVSRPVQKVIYIEKPHS